MEYLGLWDLIMDFSLQTDVKDMHIWRLSSFGQYSTNLAYDMSIFFKEQFSLGHGNEFGEVGVLASASFSLWLVAHDRCWTADQLALMVCAILSNASYVTRNRRQ